MDEVVREFEEMSVGIRRVHERDETSGRNEPGVHDRWDDLAAIPDSAEVLKEEMYEEAFRDYWRDEVPSELKRRVVELLAESKRNDVLDYLKTRSLV